MSATVHSKPRKIEGLVEMTTQQAESLFDATAQLYLGISGSEFLRRWDKGEYIGDACTSRVTRLASLISLVREQRAIKNPKDIDNL